MGRCIVHSARGGVVALFSLSGLLLSCNSIGATPGHAAQAPPPSGSAPKLAVSDTFGAADLEKRFEEVARKAAPSVVAISATDATVEADDALRSNRINPDKLAAILDPVDRTVGTGFFVDPDGYIVTNDHVVAGNQHLWVTTDDHKVYPAIIVGTDPRADLAVLKIPATHMPVVHFAPAAVQRGQWAIALGNPYGLAGGGEMAVSVGIISATNRSLPKLSNKEDRLYSDLIQTTAQINPGNSGGPLFDLRGDVMGINAAVILPQKWTNGIGFAIPVTARIKQEIEDLKQGHEVVYSWVGVRVISPTAQERKDAGMSEESGVKIEGVESNSPAAVAKLQAGDVIAAFNGHAISDSEAFVRAAGEAQVDKQLVATVYRGGKPLSVGITPARRPAPSVAVTRESQRMRWRGMLLGPVPAHWDFGPAKRPVGGLMVIAIDPKSPCVKEGVTQGSIITTIAGKAVSDVVALQRILNDTPPNACGIEMAKSQIVSAQ
ncbi:MAG: protease Do [Phycisphaerales bacterium]|nr:protease Do [Phycisphaerales bacterium]